MTEETTRRKPRKKPRRSRRSVSKKGDNATEEQYHEEREGF